MQLICPKCEIQVEIEDEGMPEKRRPVRCSSCGESWFTGGNTDLYALSFNKPSQIDPGVARILKEEAEREIAARKAEVEERLSNPQSGSGTQKTKLPENQSTLPQLTYDGYERLNWRQWSFVLSLCLVGGLVALYVFAPSVIERYPNSADLIFSYVFLVADVRQSVYEASQSSKQLLISLDIAGNAASAKEWILSTVNALVEYALSLVKSQGSDTNG